MDLHSTSYIYIVSSSALLFLPASLFPTLFTAILVLAAKLSRCLLYAFPEVNQNPKYLKLFTTSISFSLTHHFSFLFLFPPFLKTIIFIFSVLICKSFLVANLASDANISFSPATSSATSATSSAKTFVPPITVPPKFLSIISFYV